MSTAEFIHPWRSFSKVELAIAEVLHAKTGEPVEGARLDLTPQFGEPTIDLCDVTTWEKLKIGLRITVSTDELKDCIGDGEQSSKVLRCVGVLSCSASLLRRAIEMKSAGDGLWIGELILERTEVAATAALSVRLIRANDFADAPKEIAAFRGAIVGESGSVALLVDSWARPYNGPIRWKWTRFSEEENKWLKSRALDLIFIDASDTPTVFLNLEIEDFQVVLLSKERVGPTALLRDAVATGIAALAWQQLVLTCMMYPSFDEETERYQLGADWRSSVIRAATPVLYPSMETDQAIAAFREAMDDPDQRALALARVTAAAQHLAASGREFARAAKLAERVGNRQ